MSGKNKTFMRFEKIPSQEGTPKKDVRELAQELSRMQNLEQALIMDDRSPEQRVQDASIIEELARSVFPRISIEESALRKAISKWQRSGDYGYLEAFFRANQDDEVARDEGKSNGLEAMNIILGAVKGMSEKKLSHNQ